jgi:HK97 family phage portal protein
LEAFGAKKTASGVSITEATAITIPAVLAAVRVISETVGSLPLMLYRRLTPRRGKERATDHPLFALLHDAPNKFMSSQTFRETMQGHLVLWGNAYAEIERDGASRPVALWPLRPDQTVPYLVRPENTSAITKIVYATHVDGKRFLLERSQVLHIPGLGFDGLRGYSPIWLAREALGLAKASEEFAGRFFSNDAKFGVVVQHPKTLSDPAYKRLQASWDAGSGLQQAHRTKILEEGMTVERIGMPLRDAQFIEGRQFGISDVARIFRVPLALLEEHAKAATYASVEQFMLSFVVHTIRPWLVRSEQAMNQQLIPEADQASHFAEHLLDALLRGDTVTRYQAYAQGRQWGWLSANDVREFENMNPIDGGDVYMAPTNMWPADVFPDIKPPGNVSPQPIAEPVIDEEEDDEEKATIRLERETRSAQARRRLSIAFLPVLSDAARRIVQAERADVLKQAKKLGGNASSLLQWLDEYYGARPGYIRDRMAPVLFSMADAVSAQAGDEVQHVIEPARLDTFRNDYADAYVQRHVASSLGQLRDVVGSQVQDPIEALKARFAEWEEKRPGKIALREGVQLAAATAKIVWVAAGIQALKWFSFGKSCPYCTSLHGKVVGMDGAFLLADQDFQPDGAEKPLRPRRNVGHPPAHSGCDCQIVPGG